MKGGLDLTTDLKETTNVNMGVTKLKRVIAFKIFQDKSYGTKNYLNLIAGKGNTMK